MSNDANDKNSTGSIVARTIGGFIGSTINVYVVLCILQWVGLINGVVVPLF